MQAKKESLDNTLKLFNSALKTHPFDPGLFNAIGETHKKMGDLTKSIEYFEKAIKLDHNNPVYHYNLGITNHALGHASKAKANYQKAIHLNPKYEEAVIMLGILHTDLKNYNQAIKKLEKAFKINPENSYVISLLTHLSQQTCDYQSFKKWSKMLDKFTQQALAQKKDLNETPFVNLVRKDNPEESLKISRYWATKIQNSIDPSHIFIPQKNRHKKIRLGYLSNDFNDHPIAHIIADLFSSHDRKKFNVTAYSYTNNTSNIFYQKIKKGFDQFLDIKNLSPHEAAQKIYDDQIDILIDLKGFTNNSRLKICAHRPAPLQISYLGFPGTTGAPFFDYTIVDKYLTPQKFRKYFSEKLIYMPHCYQVNSPRSVSPKAFSRADFNLPPKSFVFASFNNPIKITPEVFDVWLKIIKRVPASTLWLYGQNETAQKNLLHLARSKNLGHQIVFADKIPLDEHLKRHELADLALDTFHYSGGATTSHAIWMNLPVITLPGRSYISRMGSSITNAAGLPELITSSEKEYENLAVDLATHPEKLKKIKQKLKNSPGKKDLFDIQKFTHQLEKAYLEIWQSYQKHLSPKPQTTQPKPT